MSFAACFNTDKQLRRQRSSLVQIPHVATSAMTALRRIEYVNDASVSVSGVLKGQRHAMETKEGGASAVAMWYGSGRIGTCSSPERGCIWWTASY